MQALLRFGFVLFCFLFTRFSLSAQDKIYFGSDYKEGQVIDITAGKITYQLPNTSKPVTKDLKKVILLFNDKGTFLVPADINFSAEDGKEQVERFLSHEPAANPESLIFKMDNSLLRGEIIKTDNVAVYLTSGTIIEKKTIAAIIYKNGTHELLAPVGLVAEILSAQKSTITASAKESAAVVKQPVAPAVKDGDKTITKQPASPAVKDSVKAVAIQKPGIVPTVPAASQQTPEMVVNNNAPPLFDKAGFQKKADDKIKQFTNYVKIVLDKSNDNEKVNKAIEQCLSLFVNENAIVEVSSLKREPQKKRIPQYLTDIKLIKYDKVEVVWRDVSYVTDIQQGPDGNYYGNITFEQEFKGYKDGSIVYQDITTKKADVALKTYRKTVDGKTETLWDVFISNIGVFSTRSL